MNPHAPPAQPEVPRRLIAAVLRAGSYTSAALLTLGVLLALFLPAPAVHYRLGEMFARLASLDPTAVMQAGIALLLITPVLRVAAAGLSFAYLRDFRYCAISALVLLIVISSVLFRAM